MAMLRKKKQLDELNRLISLIADDEELLSQANRYIQKLEESRFEKKKDTDTE